MSIYYGIEAEGRLKGLPTIFSSEICQEAVQAAVNKGVTHICFGVRGHVISADEYHRLRQWVLQGDIPEDWIITIHQDLEHVHRIPLDLWDRCHKILYIYEDYASLLSGDVEFKMENHTTAAIYGNPQIVPLHYVRDKELKDEDCKAP